MKQAAIFDMDGLMFDTEQMYQACWNEIAGEMGITLGEHFTREISGSNGDLLRSIVRKYYHTDDPDALFQEVVRRTEVRLRTAVPVKPGLVELLEFLKEKGVRLAVASSSYLRMIESNLNVSGTRKYFDQVVSGTSIGRGKPDPDIFLYAAEQLNLDPKDCYVLEDSINGVLAGLAAGCETIMVPDCAEPNETIRSSRAHIYRSLLEVKEDMEQGRL